MKDSKVLFYQDYMEFINYEFEPASVCNNPIVYSKEIVEVISSYNPPAIKLASGELIFIPRNDNNEAKLNDFAIRNQIKVVNRIENWALICEVFLDTEFSEEQKEHTYKLLESAGISRDRCDILRAKLGALMVAYNILSGLWDWVYLGLYDVLSACSGILVGEQLKMKEDEYIEFYKEAMEIANKDRLI